MSRETPEELIVILTIRLWDTVLNGHGIGHSTYEYMKGDPRPGDLLLEMSTVYVRLRSEGRFNSGGLGYFVKVADEPMEGAAEWIKENPDEPCPMDKFWYIRSFETGEELRWWNCRFVRVPMELMER